jgi:hypothetical protein
VPGTVLRAVATKIKWATCHLDTDKIKREGVCNDISSDLGEKPTGSLVEQW